MDVICVCPSDSGGGATLEDPASVLRTMREMNEAQTVRNEEIFGPVTNDTVVIAIQGLMLPLLFILIIKSNTVLLGYCDTVGTRERKYNHG